MNRGRRMQLVKGISIAIMTMVLPLQVQGQEIRYSPRWFGAYAQPVPELRNAQIPILPILEGKAMATLSKDEQAQALYLDVEIPLIPEAVSMRVYGFPIDHYEVSRQLAEERGANQLRGTTFGDMYLQTRIRLLREVQGGRPSIILNTTLKTASAASVVPRRSFDTPGYYFHLEGAKTFALGNSGLWHALRLSTMVGFMCWETTGSKQDDAYLYGIALRLDRPRLSCELELSGYTGWLYRHYPDYGDRPITIRMRASYTLTSNLQVVAGYEQGLRDYPQSLVHMGLRWQLPWDISKLLHR